MSNKDAEKYNRITAHSNSLTKRDSICQRIIEFGIIGVVIFSPLPAASVNDWSILGIQLAVLIMMAAYVLMKERPVTNVVLDYSLKWPKFLFGGLFLYVFLQIIPFPHLLIKFLSPNNYSFRKSFISNFSDKEFMSLSLIPSYTLQKGLELLAYFFLGFLIIKTVTKRRQIIRIFSVLIIMGIFEALYGMFELYNKNPRILFYEKIYNLDSVTGTFINRNHLSGYLEMIIPLAMGLIIARINLFSPVNMKWRKIFHHSFEKGASTNLFVSIGIIVMSLGIIFSKSRSGVFLLIFTFILFFESSILYFRKNDVQRKWIKNFLRIMFLIITFISLYIGIDATLERFTLDDFGGRRPTYWSNTIKIFADSPVCGTGLGTFSSLYPDWEEGNQIVRLYHAHNDYLEYLSEIGIVGIILLLGGILYILVTSFLIWKERRHPEVKGIGLGGIIAIFCIMIHSLTDFNLHIPANMVLFSVVLSLTFVTVFYKKSAKG